MACVCVFVSLCVICEENKLYFYNVKIPHLAIFVIVVWHMIFHMSYTDVGYFTAPVLLKKWNVITERESSLKSKSLLLGGTEIRTTETERQP